MPKLYLENGAVVEGSIDEIAELAKKLDGGEVANGYRKISGREPRVGDFVKVIGDIVDTTVGKYYEIIEIDDDGDYLFYDDVDEKSYVSPGDSRVEFYEKVNSGSGFKVGDYVVALPSADGRYGVTNTSMNLGKIIKVNGDEIRIEIVSHNHSGFVGDGFDVKKEYFRKASNREIVFGKAGRKLDEFKIGDIVRVINDHSPDLEDYEGIIAEIDNVSGTVKPYHVATPAFVKSAIDGWMWADQLELVTPVENRVDR